MDNNKLIVETPIGAVEARVMPDDEYPGIALVFAEKGSGEPGAIMEYDPYKKAIQMRVYSAEEPDDEPAAVFVMATRHGVEDLRLALAAETVCQNCRETRCEECPVKGIHVHRDSAGMGDQDKRDAEDEVAEALADILRNRPRPHRKTPKTLGEKIRFLREQKGWTQTQLGHRAGMPDSQVGTYERDETKPRTGSLERIATALGVEVSYFE